MTKTKKSHRQEWQRLAKVSHARLRIGAALGPLATSRQIGINARLNLLRLYSLFPIQDSLDCIIEGDESVMKRDSLHVEMPRSRHIFQCR